MDVKLPIDVVPGSNPPIFKWSQLVDTIAGKKVVDHQSSLPATVEAAVVRLITVAKQLLLENAGLQGQLKALQERVAPTPKPVNESPNKRKG